MSNFRRKMMLKISGDEKTVRKKIDFTDSTQEYNIILRELFPNLVSSQYNTTIWVLGAGGDGGKAGKNWGLYKGGSGGAGTNGNIVGLKKSIRYDEIVGIKKESTNSFIYNNNVVATINNGGNGGNGSDTGVFTFHGNPGVGGTSEPPTFANDMLGWQKIFSYYDAKAPDGHRDGNGRYSSPSNPLPSVLHSELADGGDGNSEEYIIQGASGGIVVETTYLPEQWGLTIDEGLINAGYANRINEYQIQFIPSSLPSDFNMPNISNTWTLKSIANTFENCNLVEILDLGGWDLSNVTDVSSCFKGCSKLSVVAIVNITPNNIIYKNEMFASCTNITRIKCKSEFKEWCLLHQDEISLPESMRIGGAGYWDIIDVRPN